MFSYTPLVLIFLYILTRIDEGGVTEQTKTAGRGCFYGQKHHILLDKLAQATFNIPEKEYFFGNE